jgi:Ca-activated chloride channel family protein
MLRAHPIRSRLLFVIVPALVSVLLPACGADIGRGPSAYKKGNAVRMFNEGQFPRELDDPNEAINEHSQFNTAAYDRIYDNPFLAVQDHPLSTFSIDVDTASYSNVRRFLNEGRLPPKDAVRVADFVNYFHYDYPQPQGEHPMSIQAEIAGCPWNSGHRLARIGLQGKRIVKEELPPRNLVFLIDTSGSMSRPTRLPLVQKGLALLVDQLTAQDRVAIVTYAGQPSFRLASTPGDQKATIMNVVNELYASGSTNGGEGIIQAYRIAQENFITDGANRVILATDGDFNVGVTNQGDLLRLIEEKRKGGVYLTVLGFGMDNLKDSTLEKLADKGNGHYAYIDSLAEAHKVFVEDGAALVTIAKDVKIQVEFNPRQVSAYRLIGYENRLLRPEEFNDDHRGATPMGAGHTVTALYEIAPAGTEIRVPGVDPLKYQEPKGLTSAANTGDAFTLKVRYKEPKEEISRLVSLTVRDERKSFDGAPANFRFATAVAAFGMLLRESPHLGTANYAQVREWARRASQRAAEREEFIQLVQKAEVLGPAKRRIAGRDAN